ncbi:unnamed protein product [Sphagnum balticum]
MEMEVCQLGCNPQVQILRNLTSAKRRWQLELEQRRRRQQVDGKKLLSASLAFPPRWKHRHNARCCVTDLLSIDTTTTTTRSRCCDTDRLSIEGATGGGGGGGLVAYCFL